MWSKTTNPRGDHISPTDLFAPGVEHLLHLPPGLGHVALLQQWEIVGVLQGDLQLPILCLLQRVQEILREPTWEKKNSRQELREGSGFSRNALGSPNPGVKGPQQPRIPHLTPPWRRAGKWCPR